MSIVDDRQSYAAVALGSTHRSRAASGLVAMAMAAALLVIEGTAAHAAIVPTVPLGTAAGYVVVGASTVTNTGDSTLYGSLGLSPGTDITGFPPGEVVAPGEEHAADDDAGQAQADVTAAYLNAKGRSVNTTTTAELAGKTLKAGVWSGPDKSPLWIGGTLTLDGEDNPNSIFIFQTDSTLITGSGSRVNLINGARECNIFWQVGSSATLGTYSDFTGTILALTAVTVTTGVTVHGRALATTAAVTLDDDTFHLPTCTSSTATTAPSGDTTVTTTPAGSTVTTSPSGGTNSTIPTGGSPGTDGTTGTGGDSGTGTTGTATDRGVSFSRPASPSPLAPRIPGLPGVVGAPRTGAEPVEASGLSWLTLLAALIGATGTVALVRASIGARGTPQAER
jgi:hypothetical protein